ncbi:sensor histidine kinase [Streptomyces sp. NPDC059816]|uniref:sensor histidine kinase n=1 Tax=Streptomyces sp. NPDC059816 TaxID=3346960 RepID=UPI003668E3EC
MGSTAPPQPGRTPRAAGRPRRLPLRKSLLGRFLAVSALVAACSVAATAWLAVQTTSGAIKKEQGQLLADDTRVYNTLLDYAATHPNWDDVQGTVDDLAQRTGRRITLTDGDRTPFADSSPQAARPTLPPQASVTVNPLAVDTALSALAGGESTEDLTTRKTIAPQTPRPTKVRPEPAPPQAVVPGRTPKVDLAPEPPEERPKPNGGVRGPVVPSSRSADESGVDRIDPRAVGPFRLSTADRTRLRVLAERQAQCYAARGLTVTLVTGPSGRPRLERTARTDTSDQMFLDDGRECDTGALSAPTASERTALDTLNDLTNACLDRRRQPRVDVGLDLTWSDTPNPSKARTSLDHRTIGLCLHQARGEQLSSHVAPEALLFITDRDGGTPSKFELSPDNTAKIAGAAALVLALTVGVSVVAGTRLVRPLHALTGAAQRMKDGSGGDRWTPVPVPADSEIGRLAAAFNDMAAHRTRLEEQRKVMVSDVAHELRTPLSNIRGWLEGAQDGVAELDKALVSSLLEEAVQLQHIIDDLQDLAEADAGALRLYPEPVPVTELLVQVAAAHQARADAAGVTLTVSASTGPAEGGGPDDPVVDPVRLRQAVGNLVTNAIRHTPSGGEVTVRAARSEPEGDLVLEVSDTGEGLTAEQLPYVFDRFWRAEKSRNRRTGGSGLGLSIVRRLTEAHGGTVSVSSTVDVGSVFTLRIPARGSVSEPAGDRQG